MNSLRCRCDTILAVLEGGDLLLRKFGDINKISLLNGGCVIHIKCLRCGNEDAVQFFDWKEPRTYTPRK